MKFFVINHDKKADTKVENNGWVLSSKSKGKLSWFYLKTPKTKEVTHSKGPKVRYYTHFVYGIGHINRRGEFKGIALFDPHIRLSVFVATLIGVAYSSMKLHIGLIWAILFYLLFLFLSSGDDERLMCCCKSMFEL